MKTISMISALLAAAFVLGAPPKALAGEPTEAVRKTVDAVIEILNDEEMRKPERSAQRRRAIREVVDDRFDFREMAQRSLSTYWRDLDEGQRDEFVGLFADLLERTYIKKIEQYEDEKVNYTGEETRGRYAKVDILVVGKDRKIDISYKLYSASGRWEVYDVVIEGMSLIRNYRSQFRDFLSSNSYEDLVKKLREKTEGNEAKAREPARFIS